VIVFVDTSAILALLASNDLMHQQARRSFAYCTEHGAQLVTSSYVLVETLALLQNRIGLQAVSDFQLKFLPLLEVIWADADWHNRAMQRLLSHGKRTLSLVDCLSFEIMESLDIKLAYSFDKHFREYGFELVAS
jgi:predicted nucleic acid-binding protein